MTSMLGAIASSRFALLLVVVVILLCLAGAVLPQEGKFPVFEIEQWQQAHPLVTKLCKPAGLFRVFHSILFLSTVFLLALNTLTCTACRIIKLKRDIGLRRLCTGTTGLRHIGFIILHLSLILIFLGGSFSAGLSLDGFIVLTEGQSFQERHDGYLRLVEGPFRRTAHKKFFITLNDASEKYQDEYVIGRNAQIEIKDLDGNTRNAEIQINKPIVYNKMSITLDEVGFSPQIIIKDLRKGTELMNSFIALRLFEQGNERYHRDNIPLPFLAERQQEIIVTFFPADLTDDNTALLVVNLDDRKLDTVQHTEIPLKGFSSLGEYEIAFVDLRRWASFRLMDDPGYALVWIALWLGTFGIILRYIPDLKKWFSPARS